MKINILFLLLFILCYSCKEYEDVKIPENAPRLDELSAQYEKLLAQPEEGWIAEYQPTANSGVVSIYMKFHNNGTVDIQSNYIGYTDVQQEIRYRVSGMVKPELVFETESIWAKLYHEAGGDYLFTIESKGNDTLLLKPVRTPYDRPTCVMSKATPTNKAAFYKSISTMEKLNGFVKNAVAYFKNLELSSPLGNINAFTEFNIDKGSITLTYLDERGNITITERKYKVEGDRILLIPSAIVNNIEIQYFQLGELDQNGNMLIQDAGLGLSGQLSTAHIPPFPYNGSADYYTTGDIFMTYTEASEAMQGLIDPIKNISGYQGLQFYINRYVGTVSPHTITLYANGIWGRYYVNVYTEGEDAVFYQYLLPGGSTTGKELAEKNFNTVKPFLDKMCETGGYTIILSADKKAFTLVNRTDSRYWIKLTISERNL